MIYINDIKETFLDFPNDEDQAVIVFFEGCSHNCEDCQNKELQVRNKLHATGSADVYNIIIDRCNRSKVSKIVLSGGDPFFKKSNEDLVDMLNLISSLEDDGFEVCVYTGWNIDQVKSIYNELGTEVDFFTVDINKRSTIIKRLTPPTYLKCGKYNKHLLNPDMGKTDDCFILASSNQDFFKRVSEDSFEYKRISADGILKFR